MYTYTYTYIYTYIHVSQVAAKITSVINRMERIVRGDFLLLLCCLGMTVLPVVPRASERGQQL